MVEKLGPNEDDYVCRLYLVILPFIRYGYHSIIDINYGWGGGC
jgi:hypothetical protein